jgi:hypothetical protein
MTHVSLNLLKSGPSDLHCPTSLDVQKPKQPEAAAAVSFLQATRAVALAPHRAAKQSIQSINQSFNSTLDQSIPCPLQQVFYIHW